MEKYEFMFAQFYYHLFYYSEYKKFEQATGTYDPTRQTKVWATDWGQTKVWATVNHKRAELLHRDIGKRRLFTL